jgi:hypothetical protein
LGIWRTADQSRVNKGLPLLALFQRWRAVFRRRGCARLGVRSALDTATALTATQAPRPGNDAPFRLLSPP